MWLDIMIGFEIKIIFLWDKINMKWQYIRTEITFYSKKYLE